MSDQLIQVPANSPGATPNNLIIPDVHAEERGAFKDDLAAITAEIEAEFKASNDARELGDDPPPDVIPDLAPEDPAPTPVVEKDDPAVGRGLDRLVAREVELKSREAKAVEAETRAQAMMAEAKQYSGLKSTKELAALAQHSPSKVAAALGMDPTTMVRIMLAEQIEASGKPVPPELKEFVKDAADKRWRSDMEAKLAAKDAAIAQQSYFNSVNEGGRQYVTKVGDSTPTVKAVATANPDLAFAEIMEEIGKAARVAAQTDPNAPLISYDEAAKRVEARWAPLRTAVAGQQGTDSTKQAPGAKKIQPPPAKPPSRPIAPWMAKTNDDLVTQGINEALREFHRSEAESKRAR